MLRSSITAAAGCNGHLVNFFYKFEARQTAITVYLQHAVIPDRDQVEIFQKVRQMAIIICSRLLYL